MPQRAATIESLATAFEVVKAMQADGLEWGEGYRALGRQALAVDGTIIRAHQHGTGAEGGLKIKRSGVRAAV